MLELNILILPSYIKNISIDVNEMNSTKCKTFINLNSVMYLSEHPDDNNLTNIYLTNGKCLISSCNFKKIKLALQSHSNIPNKLTNNDEY